jgi:hypothetical protein
MPCPTFSCLRPLCALLAALVLAGCGAAASPASAMKRAPAVAAARTAEGDAALVKALALEAHASLSRLDETYAELKLNTPGGRRFTPEQETRVRDGLTPAIARLDDAATTIATRLREDARTSRVQTFAGRFGALAPRTGADAALEPTATALLFRVSQYRVKLGAVIDFALEQGWLTELPARPAADRTRKG